MRFWAIEAPVRVLRLGRDRARVRLVGSSFVVGSRAGYPKPAPGEAHAVPGSRLLESSSAGRQRPEVLDHQHADLDSPTAFVRRSVGSGAADAGIDKQSDVGQL
jgi:hypothetical protein